MRNMTPEWRMLCVLWIISSAGVAGVTAAMAYKSQTTTVQKATPLHNINRAGKSDKSGKIKLPEPRPQPRFPFPVVRNPIQI